jgi:hypothetical protein
MKRLFLASFAIVFGLAAQSSTAKSILSEIEDKEVTITLVRWPYT